MIYIGSSQTLDDLFKFGFLITGTFDMVFYHCNNLSYLRVLGDFHVCDPSGLRSTTYLYRKVRCIAEVNSSEYYFVGHRGSVRTMSIVSRSVFGLVRGSLMLY